MLPKPGLEGVSKPSLHSPVVRTQLHGRTWCRKLRMWSVCPGRRGSSLGTWERCHHSPYARRWFGGWSEDGSCKNSNDILDQ